MTRALGGGTNVMSNRLLSYLLAALVFLGVGYFVLDNRTSAAFRDAETARDGCYMRSGIPVDPRGGPVTGIDIPAHVRTECTRPIADYQDGETGRYLIAALAGLVAALVVLGIFAGLRRKAGAGAE